MHVTHQGGGHRSHDAAKREVLYGTPERQRPSHHHSRYVDSHGGGNEGSSNSVNYVNGRTSAVIARQAIVYKDPRTEPAPAARHSHHYTTHSLSPREHRTNASDYPSSYLVQHNDRASSNNNTSNHRRHNPRSEQMHDQSHRRHLRRDDRPTVFAPTRQERNHHIERSPHVGRTTVTTQAPHSVSDIDDVNQFRRRPVLSVSPRHTTRARTADLRTTFNEDDADGGRQCGETTYDDVGRARRRAYRMHSATPHTSSRSANVLYRAAASPQGVDRHAITPPPAAQADTKRPERPQPRHEHASHSYDHTRDVLDSPYRTSAPRRRHTHSRHRTPRRAHTARTMTRTTHHHSPTYDTHRDELAQRSPRYETRFAANAANVERPLAARVETSRYISPVRSTTSITARSSPPQQQQQPQYTRPVTTATANTTRHYVSTSTPPPLSSTTADIVRLSDDTNAAIVPPMARTSAAHPTSYLYNALPTSAAQAAAAAGTSSAMQGAVGYGSLDNGGRRREWSHVSRNVGIGYAGSGGTVRRPNDSAIIAAARSTDVLRPRTVIRAAVSQPQSESQLLYRGVPSPASHRLSSDRYRQAHTPAMSIELLSVDSTEDRRTASYVLSHSAYRTAPAELLPSQTNSRATASDGDISRNYVQTKVAETRAWIALVKQGIQAASAVRQAPSPAPPVQATGMRDRVEDTNGDLESRTDSRVRRHGGGHRRHYTHKQLHHRHASHDTRQMRHTAEERTSTGASRTVRAPRNHSALQSYALHEMSTSSSSTSTSTSRSSSGSGGSSKGGRRDSASDQGVMKDFKRALTPEPYTRRGVSSVPVERSERRPETSNPGGRHAPTPTNGHTDYTQSKTDMVAASPHATAIATGEPHTTVPSSSTPTATLLSFLSFLDGSRFATTTALCDHNVAIAQRLSDEHLDLLREAVFHHDEVAFAEVLYGDDIQNELSVIETMIHNHVTANGESGSKEALPDPSLRRMQSAYAEALQTFNAKATLAHKALVEANHGLPQAIDRIVSELQCNEPFAT